MKATKAKPTTADRAQEIAAQMKAENEDAQEKVLLSQAQAQADAEAADVERLARLEEIKARVQTDFSGAELVTVRADLEKALEKFFKVNREYSDRFNELAPIFDDTALKPLPENWAQSGHNIFRPIIDGVTIPRATPQHELKELAYAAIRKHYGDRGFIDLENPHDR